MKPLIALVLLILVLMAYVMYRINRVESAATPRVLLIAGFQR